VKEGLTILLAGKPPCTFLPLLYRCLIDSKSNCIPVAVGVPSSASTKNPDTNLPAPTPTIPIVTVTKPAVVIFAVAGIPAIPTLPTNSNPEGKVLASPVKVMLPTDDVDSNPLGTVLALAAKVKLPKPRVASLVVQVGVYNLCRLRLYTRQV
jgi:hypothetical protein